MLIIYQKVKRSLQLTQFSDKFICCNLQKAKKQQLQQNQPGWQTSQYYTGAQQQQVSSQGAISGQQQQQKEIGTGASQQYMGSGQHQQAPHLSKDLGSQGTQQNVTKEQFQQKNLPKQMQL
eukprot:403346112